MIEVSGAALAGHSFLRGLPRDQLSVLAEVACDVKFPARCRLFEDGGNATCSWLIQSGHVTLDLHDLVIQRLYATGMSLEGTMPMITRPEVASRITNAVDAVTDNGNGIPASGRRSGLRNFAARAEKLAGSFGSARPIRALPRPGPGWNGAFRSAKRPCCVRSGRWHPTAVENFRRDPEEVVPFPRRP
jgi:hypothetical protein